MLVIVVRKSVGVFRPLIEVASGVDRLNQESGMATYSLDSTTHCMFSIGARHQGGVREGLMNPMDRLLRDELNRLLDRIAATTRPGVAKASARHLPDLRIRLDEAEARLSAKRQVLLEQYAQWQEALEACEDLWAVAQLELEETGAGGIRRAA